MKRAYIFLLSAAFLSVAVWGLVFIKTQRAVLEVDFLDVGQGDSILVATPYGQTMLVDGGPGNKVLDKLSSYLPPLQKRIDIVVLTHPHADHVTGLVEVLKRYDVGAVVLSAAYLKTGVYGEFLSVLRDKNAPIILAEAGQALHFGKELNADILSPEGGGFDLFGGHNESFGAAGNDVNDDSVVMKLVFGGFAMLMTGDATSAVEKKLSDYGDNLRSDILKVGHHGSKYSSSWEFLDYVKPKAAVIEVGAKNRYGHPAKVTLERLKNLNISIFRTDKDGDIKILSDGVATNIFKEK